MESSRMDRHSHITQRTLVDCPCQTCHRCLPLMHQQHTQVQSIPLCQLIGIPHCLSYYSVPGLQWLYCLQGPMMGEHGPMPPHFRQMANLRHIKAAEVEGTGEVALERASGKAHFLCSHVDMDLRLVENCSLK